MESEDGKRRLCRQSVSRGLTHRFLKTDGKKGEVGGRIWRTYEEIYREWEEETESEQGIYTDVSGHRETESRYLAVRFLKTDGGQGGWGNFQTIKGVQ